MTLNVVDEGVAHIHAPAGRTQQHMVLAQRIAKLEEQLGLARILSNQFVELSHNLLVEHLRVGDNRDGNALDGVLLYRLQVFHSANLQLLGTIVVILETGTDLAHHIDRGANGVHTAILSPVLAK